MQAENRTKLLIVDDLPENLLALSKILERDEHQVFQASSGDVALALLLEHDFALAILDVMMPGMDGFELAELMRGKEKTRQIPIVFVSAAGAELDYAFKGYESGAVDFLYKPLDIAAVRSKVSVFVSLHQQKQAMAGQVEDLEKSRAALRHTQTELEYSLKMRDDFMSTVAHELRTPLNTLFIESQLRRMLLDKGDMNAFGGDQLRRMVARDTRQIQSMIRLIDDMVDVSRIRSGKLSIQPADTDLSQLLRQIVSDMSHRADNAGCAISLETPDSVMGRWDEFRLEQVVVNLLTNALRYGRGKPVTVTLTLAGDHAELTVRDQGVGIAPADQIRIFEPFERAGSNDVRDGLGLGLYIARQLAEAHDGLLEVESRPGEGALFRMTLPLAQLIAH